MSQDTYESGTAHDGGQAASRPAVRRLRGLLTAVPAAAAGFALAARHAFELYHPPAARPGRTPQSKGLPVRDLTVRTTRDGVALQAWVVPGTGPHTVVICHGMGRTRSSVLGHIELLHGAGHHVVAYDMRNHGDSGRDRKIRGMSGRFTSDLEDVIAAVRRDPETGGGELALFGFSFSTWVSLHVLRRIDPAVAAVVCDSGPMSDTKAGLRHFAGLRRTLLPEPVRDGPGFTVYRSAFARFCLHMLAVRNWPPDLTGVPTRLMFVAGAQDPVIQVPQIMAVADRYPDAERWTAPQAMHMNALRFDAAEYRPRVLDFLASAFSAAAGRRAEAAGRG
ncbi:alpha/beta hydrolase [Streptomyces sp. NBC_01408]|uniref:alpha/beta hydrolase n=1 Tax=Streptomyces sp. NBC_01408 TaxID=2903855 RepID=UPI002252AAFD|nr:alpha/beta fold hydrolase [Streptomyces sp. NBC_01408]MCX4693188.1 alpha/beta hydrolase [Streptomyces sp. NBC_01408]